MTETILTSVLAMFVGTLIFKPFKLIYRREWEEFRVKYPPETNQNLLQLNFLMNCKVARVLYAILAVVIFLSCLIVGVAITSRPNPVHHGFVWYSKFWGVLIVALSSVPVWKMTQIAFG